MIYESQREKVLTAYRVCERYLDRGWGAESVQRVLKLLTDDDIRRLFNLCRTKQFGYAMREAASGIMVDG